jgi:uncharacterized RDD family membrane protein YckC
MKCPKCGYLGFEHVDRCRNCGYDFSLAATAPATPELPMREGRRDFNPLDDLALVDEAVPLGPPERNHGQASPALDLPLFGGDDQPLITRPSAPRAPLAVRRATSDPPRGRPQPSSRAVALKTAPMLDLAGGEATVGVDPGPPPSVAGRASAAAEPLSPPAVEDRAAPAGVAARAAAAAIDVALLGAIDVAVVYLTIKICGLSTADLHVLPAAPLIAFLLVQNGGYLITFTAGGQTLGKMATGIRVVPASADAPLDMARSALRTLVWAVLALPAGLGFVSTFFDTERRGLHDRCAGTRVVRASA